MRGDLNLTILSNHMVINGVIDGVIGACHIDNHPILIPFNRFQNHFLSIFRSSIIVVQLIGIMIKMIENEGINPPTNTSANHPNDLGTNRSSTNRQEVPPSLSSPCIPTNILLHQEAGEEAISVSSTLFDPLVSEQVKAEDMEVSRRGSITTQVLTSSKESKQNQESVDTPEEIISLTRKLIASGGFIRALLSSDQPLSTMQAQWDDTGKEGAGQKIAIKVEEEEEEEEDEQEERFVRPPRLRFTLSDEAASDGFPSVVARSLRWHPDHMQDRPGEAANLSIRAAFDTKYDEHYVFRDWRPSQGTPFDLFFLVSAL